MIDTTSPTTRFRIALESHASEYKTELRAAALDRFTEYYEILSAWNARLHLVAPCAPEEFATRHILESLLLLPYLPPAAAVADIGSGAGLPIIPCLIARPDLKAVLVESMKKKAVFLREALKLTGTSISATVVAERFETIATPEVGFVTCRALDHFDEMLRHLIEWSPRPSTLLLFGGEALREKIESAGLPSSALPIPHSQKRFLIAALRT
jgi:16S rRNA (guanine527-N7)-methyltransferase